MKAISDDLPEGEPPTRDNYDFSKRILLLCRSVTLVAPREYYNRQDRGKDENRGADAAPPS